MRGAKLANVEGFPFWLSHLPAGDEGDNFLTYRAVHCAFFNLHLGRPLRQTDPGLDGNLQKGHRDERGADAVGGFLSGQDDFSVLKQNVQQGKRAGVLQFYSGAGGEFQHTAVSQAESCFPLDPDLSPVMDYELIAVL